ncbi:bifunctional serine/threonine-protein kinase/formylglycine-generating enzyme family protein [Gilvimarinus xylanilyticus]|uniref:non-specific serine/threonine protein kinase n=1 Tax=Gilvimarinus xylanilyticus TaxID=2944139 RepID=A0A9X2KSX3_9GAMM|nr:bifunctional serine/threonine-protein kinase/formylglycine-generating enzyme family protein [Gilvimarinus xylanilyticus]MCP8898587.1 bifunctional serine/threonine-protein kinase/formylglycine-generating enzyme family protein [Gilvimarinus xylanilyticus]
MQIPGYRIIRKINHGGMSTVYLAIQESVGRVVALKVMSPALNSDPSYSERFQREANIVGQLSHPHIVSIYDIGKHDNLNYIAMDYLPGGSIHDRMLAGIDSNDALKILKEIGAALDHAHEKGYVHRDIKPENVLFRDDGSAVLTDFGVARAQSLNSRATHAGTVVGTPHYMSPEQARGKTVDSRSDLYSLGIVFYEMLTGSVPYQGEEAVAIALKHLASPLPVLPKQFSHCQPILDTLLDKEPGKRYQHGQQLVQDVEALQLQIREQGERRTASLSQLGGQLSSALGIVWRKFKASCGTYWKQCSAFIASIRFAKGRGFYRVETTHQEQLRSLTQQNTLVATRVHRQVSPAGAAALWHDLGTWGQRAVWATAALVLVLIALLLWPADTQPPATKTGDIVSASKHSAKGKSPQPLASSAGSLANSAQSSPAPTAIASAHAHAETSEAYSSPPPADSPLIETAGTQVQPRAEFEGRPGTTLENARTAVDTEIELASRTNAEPEFEPTPEPDNAQPPEPEVEKFSLTVAPKPANARVRIMNIREKYHDGIALAPGAYQIEVTAPGYREHLEWMDIDDTDLNYAVELAPSRPAGAEFTDTLENGERGPVMVVIPAGSFTMGGPDSNSQPRHEVSFARPFAMSKFEITFADYDRFVEDQSLALPGDNRWGREQRPVINVSWEEAELYAQWLSMQTGKTYRLPTEAEWEYAARGGRQSRFWWGDEASNAAAKANCKRHCDSGYTGLFRTETAPVGSFQTNDYGLHDIAGNVAEWTQDCYRDTYQGASPDGSAYSQKNCPARVVRGGSLNDGAEALGVYQRRYQPQHTYHTDIGIRLVVEEL